MFKLAGFPDHGPGEPFRLQGWKSSPKQEEAAGLAHSLATTVINSRDLEKVEVPSAAQPASNMQLDHCIKYRTWQIMLLSLIAHSVCGKTRDHHRKGTDWKTQRLVINAAGGPGATGEAPLADQLYDWKQAVEKQLDKAKYDKLSCSEAAAWRAWLWLKGLQARVYQTSSYWEHHKSKDEGIRKAAQVVVSWSFSELVRHGAQ